MQKIIDNAIASYANDQTATEPELLISLIQATTDIMQYPEKLSGRIVGRLLKLLVQISHSKRVIDIGLFTGYSALSMAEGLPKDGSVIACETNPKAIDLAQSYFDKSPYGHKVDVRFGPAVETLKTLEPGFDLAFIDADKRNYINYYELCIEKIKPGGLIVIDNTLWSGRVLSPENEDDHILAQLNTIIANDSRVDNVFLTIRDGVNLVRKHL